MSVWQARFVAIIGVYGGKGSSYYSVRAVSKDSRTAESAVCMVWTGEGGSTGSPSAALWTGVLGLECLASPSSDVRGVDSLAVVPGALLSTRPSGVCPFSCLAVSSEGVESGF